MGSQMHIRGAAFPPLPAPRPPVGPVRPASSDAQDIMQAARFVRLATMMRDAITADEMDAVLATLRAACAGHSFRFTGRQGDRFADLLEVMAAQVAAQDAGEAP